MDHQQQLSRRERQIMTLVYSRGEASATDVWEDLPNPPSRTAVRTMLRILEDKGLLRHHKRGREFVYQPVQARSDAGRSALGSVVQTFFDGSLEQAVAAHLADPSTEFSDDELRRLASLVRKARQAEKKS
ncbi:MAG: BlaI/MecI/CopY family transcriptional regulator [Planctomycetales bacterium]|nr:BlaI/MecI/CopY family transcriptional regulator [Planctomycetales bacterium]